MDRINSNTNWILSLVDDKISRSTLVSRKNLKKRQDQEVDNMSKLAILVIVLLGLAYFIDAREERLFFGRRQVCNFGKTKK